MNTYMPSAASIERKWYVVDATDMTLGRLASEVAIILRGKNKPTYTPFLDCGDYVIIVNCGKIKVTGKKILLKTQLDQSILGGVIVKMGDKLIDGSVARQMQMLKNALLRSELRIGVTD